MWQRRNLSTARSKRRPPSPARTSNRFEQRLAARHMMLHWLATEQATAAVDTGKRSAQHVKPPPRQPSRLAKIQHEATKWTSTNKSAMMMITAQEQWRWKNQQVSHGEAAASGRLSDLLGRCRPAEVRPVTSHPAQSRLAQMPWCYQGPLRRPRPSSAVPAVLQDVPATPIEFEDQESGLDRGAPYLDFLEKLTERLVEQPQLSSEALHAVCESCIASNGGDLDPDILWELMRELFADVDQEEDGIEP